MADALELDRLHAALLDGDPTAPALLAELLLPALAERLRTLPAPDPHAVSVAIDDVVFEYLQSPTMFDPNKGDLIAYLAMAVRGDVANATASRARRVAHLATADVELEVVGGNTEEEAVEHLDPFDRSPAEVARAREMLAALGPRDRQLMELIYDDVRPTAPYAEILGIGHLPVRDQAREVKRAKDRLKKQMERLSARFRQ